MLPKLALVLRNAPDNRGARGFNWSESAITQRTVKESECSLPIPEGHVNVSSPRSQDPRGLIPKPAAIQSPNGKQADDFNSLSTQHQHSLALFNAPPSNSSGPKGQWFDTPQGQIYGYQNAQGLLVPMMLLPGQSYGNSSPKANAANDIFRTALRNISQGSTSSTDAQTLINPLRSPQVGNLPPIPATGAMQTYTDFGTTTQDFADRDREASITAGSLNGEVDVSSSPSDEDEDQTTSQSMKRKALDTTPSRQLATTKKDRKNAHSPSPSSLIKRIRARHENNILDRPTPRLTPIADSTNSLMAEYEYEEGSLKQIMTVNRRSHPLSSCNLLDLETCFCLHGQVWKEKSTKKI